MKTTLAGSAADNIVISRGGVAIGSSSSQTVVTWELIPAGMTHTVAGLLDFVRASGCARETTLMIPTKTVDMTPPEDAVKTANDSGWALRSDVASIGITGWSTWRHETTDQVVHIGILGLIDADRTPLFDPTETAAVICTRLIQYAAANGGVPWHMTAGVSGGAALRAIPRRYQPLWHPPTSAAYERTHGAGDLHYSRLDPTKAYQLIRFDTRAAYLAAARRLSVAVSRLHHEPDPMAFDASQGGYWRIDAKGLDELWLIDRGKIAADGTTWVTTPIMSALIDLGARPMVRESWLGHSSGAPLRAWADQLVTALGKSDPMIRPALKRTYAETLGLMKNRGGAVYRPDWRDAVIDAARAAITYRIRKVWAELSVTPMRVHVDGLYYAAPDGVRPKTFAQQIAAVLNAPPAGAVARVGQMRYEGIHDVEPAPVQQDITDVMI